MKTSFIIFKTRPAFETSRVSFRDISLVTLCTIAAVLSVAKTMSTYEDFLPRTLREPVPQIQSTRAGQTESPASKKSCAITACGIDHLQNFINDPAQRISQQFQVPKSLEPRVQFWLDIYTKYPSSTKVIHHERYPWIRFKIVDTLDILNAQKPRKRWLRNLKADEFVESQTLKLESLFAKAGRIPKDKWNQFFIQLSYDEQSALNLLYAVPDFTSLQSAAKEAAESVRIQTGQRDFFLGGIRKADPFFSQMEAVFAKEGLPAELTRLPLIESSFNHQATSKAGAKGVWQFIDETGKKYLRIEKNLDERESIIKSSRAAAKLLTENFQLMKRDWSLAVTAYNHGPGGIFKAMRETKSRDLASIINNYNDSRFGFASENYYSEFLAGLLAETYREVYFPELNVQHADDQAISLANESLKSLYLKTSVRGDRLMEFLRSNEMRAQFLKLNPDLHRPTKTLTYLPRGFELIVSTSMVNDLNPQQDGGQPKSLRKKHVSSEYRSSLFAMERP